MTVDAGTYEGGPNPARSLKLSRLIKDREGLTRCWGCGGVGVWGCGEHKSLLGDIKPTKRLPMRGKRV